MREGMGIQEAKKQLAGRYERNAHRISSQKPADVLGRALNAFANALDPHTGYLSADTLEDFRISMELSLDGIGVSLISRHGYAIVQEIIPGGAAERHGGAGPSRKRYWSV